jgi:DNA-directed RNA polymerase specialized sigma54-like protein
LKPAVESVASLIISSVQSAARYFVTRSSSNNFLYSGLERVFVRYVLASALAAEQVRERVASLKPLSVFAAQLWECAIHSFSALVAFLRSHYLARRVEA